MKKFVLILVLAFSLTAYGQFKDPGFPTESVKDGIITNQSNNLFGFLNSDNFLMRHQYNLSYSSFGGHGLALGIYTNSMFYRIAENLDIQADISLMHSPYSSFGKEFQDDLTGIYLSRAAVNYRPWKDFSVSVQYRNLPASFYYPYGFYRGSFFNRYDYYDPFFGN
jgi:hypothetical protein